MYRTTISSIPTGFTDEKSVKTHMKIFNSWAREVG